MILDQLSIFYIMLPSTSCLIFNEVYFRPNVVDPRNTRYASSLIHAKQKSLQVIESVYINVLSDRKHDGKHSHRNEKGTS